MTYQEQEAQLMLTNLRDTSVEVIKHGTIRFVRHDFLLVRVRYSNFIRKMTFLRYSTSKIP